MSCWVVPTIAADLWGCTVEHIWAGIRDGKIPTREENGWLFVDVAPDSLTIGLPKAMRPPTYTVVNAADESAGVADPAEEAISEPAPALFAMEPAGLSLDDALDQGAEGDEADRLPLEDDPDAPLGDWRAARAQASRLRRPPGAPALPPPAIEAAA